MKKLALLAALLTVAFSSVWAQGTDKSIEVKEMYGEKYKFYRDGQKLNCNDIRVILAQDPEAYPEAKIAARQKKTSNASWISGALLFAGGSITMFMESDNIPNTKLYTPAFIVASTGAGLLIVSIPFSHSAKRHAAKAVNIYNENQKSTSYWDNAELNFGFTGNGLGLTLSF